MKILTIDITGKCNLECRFCYQTSIGELSTEQVMQHINANPDFNSVEIGGGEPFMHPELFEILRKINDSGKTINVSTNATCVSNEFLNLESIIREKITLQVSLQAGNSESYEHVTGSNFFDLVLGNIGRLKEKYQTVISSSIYADNFDTVREILSLAYGFNVPARINLVFPKGRGKDVKLLDGRQVDSNFSRIK